MDNLTTVSEVLTGWMPIKISKDVDRLLTAYSIDDFPITLNLPSNTESVFNSLEDAVSEFIFNVTKFKMNINENIAFISFKYYESDIEFSKHLFERLCFPYHSYLICPYEDFSPTKPPVRNRYCVEYKTFKCKSSITVTDILSLNHTLVFNILKRYYPMITSSNNIFSYNDFLKGIIFKMVKEIVSMNDDTEIGDSILDTIHIVLSKLDSSSELYEFYTIIKAYVVLINNRLYKNHDIVRHEIYLDAMEMLLNKIISSSQFVRPIP